MIKCEACRAFYYFFATNLINSIDSIYHMTYIFIKNRLDFVMVTNYNGRHNVSPKSVNH